MRAVAVQPPFCSPQEAGSATSTNCGMGYVTVALFFVLFQLLGALLLMNLMVGVVVDEFSSASIQEGMRVPKMVVLEFQEAWVKLDEEGTHFIRAAHLPKLLSKMLRPPLGVSTKEGSSKEGMGGAGGAGGGGGCTGKAASSERQRRLSGEGGSPMVAVLRRLEEAWLPVRFEPAIGAYQCCFEETLFALARCEAGQRLPECAPSTTRTCGLTPTHLLTASHGFSRLLTPLTPSPPFSHRCALRAQLDKDMRKKLELRTPHLKDAAVE